MRPEAPAGPTHRLLSFHVLPCAEFRTFRGRKRLPGAFYSYCEYDMITGECTEERDILECSCVELKARWSRAPQRTCHCPLRIGHPPVRQGLRTGGHIPLCHCRPHREPRYCTASDRGRPKPLCRLCPPSVIPPRFPISPLLEHLDLQSCGYPISEGRPLARPPPIPQRSGRGRAARIVYVQPGYFKSGEFALPTHGQLFRAPSFRKRGHLHHPVPDRRNPRRPQLAIRLRDDPPPRRLPACQSARR